MALIKINRTKTGVVPGSLADGELYIDQLNNKLYWADSTGTVRNGNLLDLPIPDNTVVYNMIASAAIAAAADFLAGTASKLLPASAVWAAAAPVVVSWGSTITLDMSTLINAKITMTGNSTLAAPTNTKPGQSGSIFFTQDGTGSRTLAFDSVWKTAGGYAQTLSTAAGTVDRLDYVVLDSTHIHYALAKKVS
jgi:hypothetical protein